LKWIFSEAGSMKSAAPAVNANGTVVYICDALGKAFAIDAASGQKKWQFSAGDAGRGLLVNGSEQMIGTQTDAFFVNIETGEQIAKVTLGCEMSDITGFAVNSDKTLAYFGGRNGYIGAVNIKTHEAIKSLVVEKDNPNLLYEPVVAPNGSVFAGSKNGSVLQREGRPFGRQLGVRPHRQFPRQRLQLLPPVRRQRKPLLHHFGTDLYTTYIFDASGNVVDSWTYESGDNNQKQMGGNNYLDGVIYSAFIGGSSKNGVFVGKYVGGERASSWSTHGGDICGSCCVK